MTVAAELLVVAADTGLLIVFGLDRVDADKVAAVVFRHVVALEGRGAQRRIYATADMAIVTERLCMAFDTVGAGLAGQGAVFPHPVGVLVVPACPVVVMGQGDTLLFVTGVTVLQLHFGKIFMRHLFSAGLLLVAYEQPVDQ